MHVWSAALEAALVNYVMNKIPLVLENLKYVAASAHLGYGCGIRHLCVLLQVCGGEKIIYFHAFRSRTDLAAGSVYPTVRVCLASMN